MYLLLPVVKQVVLDSVLFLLAEIYNEFVDQPLDVWLVLRSREEGGEGQQAFCVPQSVLLKGLFLEVSCADSIVYLEIIVRTTSTPQTLILLLKTLQPLQPVVVRCRQRGDVVLQCRVNT